MTNEEALKTLNYIIDNMAMEFSNRGLLSAIICGKNAIEKQMPKKPIHKRKNYYCPICKEDGWVLWDDVKPNAFNNFCGRCGQAIDWSKE